MAESGHQESFATGRFQASRSTPVGTRVLAALINAQVHGSRTALSRHQLLGFGARALACLRWSATSGAVQAVKPIPAGRALRPALCGGSDGLYGRQGQDADGRAQSPKPGSEVQLHPWSAGAAPDEAAKRRSGCQSRCRADGMAAGGKAAIGGRRGAPDIAATRRTPQRAKPGSFTSCRVRRDDSASHAAKRSPPLEAGSLYWLRTKACQPSSRASASSACKRWRRAGDIVPGAHRARSKQAEGRAPVGRWVPQFAQRGQLGEHRVAGGRTQCQGFQAPLL